MSSAAGAVEADAGDPAAIGDVVAGRYAVERLLGRGASGVVYAARRLVDDETVALKIIHPELCHSRQIFGRYKREAAILRHLRGRHIVEFLDFFEHDGLLVIALEHVRGDSLEKLLESRMEVGVATDIALQICAGLGTAHEAGVVHRDLKPANVMVEQSDGLFRARILDFGLAKVVFGEHMTTGLTERDMIFGTPEYMAPEQARGDDVDVRCDVYSLGVILYEMVTGSVPLKGRTPLATMTAQMTEDVDPPRSRAPGRNVPPALEAVVLRALAKDRGDRFPSIAAMAEALAAAAERRVISVNPREDESLHSRDTELALRRSQIKAASSLLAEAEDLAKSKAEAALLRGPSSSKPHEPSTPQWIWPIIAIVAILTCIVLGVLLALQ